MPPTNSFVLSAYAVTSSLPFARLVKFINDDELGSKPLLKLNTFAILSLELRAVLELTKVIFVMHY